MIFVKQKSNYIILLRESCILSMSPFFHPYLYLFYSQLEMFGDVMSKLLQTLISLLLHL